MSYKVLHIVDVWLPVTMNWLSELLSASSSECEHHVYATYQISAYPNGLNPVNEKKFNTYPINSFHKLRNRINKPLRLHELKKQIARIQPDVLHIHFGNLAIEYKSLLLELNIPFCISLYGYDYEYLPKKDPLTVEHYKALAQRGGLFLVEGNYSSRLLMGYGIPNTHIRKLHLLFPRTFPPIHPRWHSPIRLLQVATITEKKNQLGFVESLQSRHAGKFSIRMFGEPHDPNYHRELTKCIQHKHKHDIQLFPLIPIQQYLQELSECHFSVQWSQRSSNADTEGGCPVFLKDSLIAGRPIISSRHCDIPEWLIHGFNGFLTEENNQLAFIDILDQLLQLSPYSYTKLKRNAQLGVQENLHMLHCKQELLQIYQLQGC